MPQSIPQLVRITKESTFKLTDKIYIACLKADPDGVNEYSLNEALEIIYPEVKRGHDAVKGNSIYLERLGTLLPVMISKRHDFRFPRTLKEMNTEIIVTMKPSYKSPLEDS